MSMNILKNFSYSGAFRGLFWLALVLLGVFSLQNVWRAHAQNQITDGSSVVLREEITKADGTKFPSAIYTFATRSDGSAVSMGLKIGSTAQEPVRMIRLASGSQGYISDSTHQKYMTALGADANPASPPNLRTPSSRCTMAVAKESALGVEQIGDYRAERITGTDGNRTSWYALDYGCALVKEHFDWNDGSKTDKVLMMLRPGEPEASLFAVPSNYVDVPRSSILH